MLFGLFGVVQSRDRQEGRGEGAVTHSAQSYRLFVDNPCFRWFKSNQCTAKSPNVDDKVLCDHNIPELCPNTGDPVSLQHHMQDSGTGQWHPGHAGAALHAFVDASAKMTTHLLGTCWVFHPGGQVSCSPHHTYKVKFR